MDRSRYVPRARAFSLLSAASFPRLSLSLLPRSSAALRPREGPGSPTMWNDSAHRGKAASAATIRERGAENGGAAAEVRAIAGSAREVRATPRPRSSEGGPAAAAGAAPCPGACLRPGSLLQHTNQLAESAPRDSRLTRGEASFLRHVLYNSDISSVKGTRERVLLDMNAIQKFG